MAKNGQLPGVVCFDYFDTLVTRSVFPEATKQLAARQLVSLLANEVGWKTLYELRSGLEKKLCKESQVSGYDAEFVLDDLAGRMYNVMAQIGGYPEWLDRDRFIGIFADIELNIEKRVQRPCPVFFDLLHYLHEKETVLCLMSDFYFSREQFLRMLKFHSIDSFFKGVFVSADHKISKGGSGKLYTVAAEKMNCDVTEMLMIGDNIHSDYEMAKHAGLQARHVDRSAQYSKYQQFEALSRKQQEPDKKCLLEDIFATVFEDYRTPFFAEMGLSLWFFIHHLFIQVQKQAVSHLFFCSKEGEFLKKLFVQYQEQCFGKQIITCHYLLVSRKATFICSLDNLENEDFSRLFSHYADISFKEFLLSLNFSEETALKICDEHDLEYDKKFRDFRSTKQFSELKKSSSFREKYEAHRLEQRKNLRHYLDTFGADIKEKGLTLVDVGWKGSIQNNIYKSLGGNVLVRGFYIGSLSPTETHTKNRKFGILFSDTPTHSPYIHAFNNNRSLFEMLLGATHGSADGYFSKELYQNQEAARKSVVLKSFGDNDDHVVTGVDLPEERELFNTKIAPIQAVFLKMNYHLTERYCLDTGDCPDLQWFARHHARMVFRPSKEEVEFFSLLYHLENFGLFEFTDFQAENNISISRRLKNFKMLLQNPAGVLETGVWPPVILKRLGLEFMQPIDGMKRYKRVFGK